MTQAEDKPLRTCLYDKHVAAGAEMAVEDGWELPRSYGDVAGECRQAHIRAAVFDLTHVGRIRIRGEGALDMLERLCTADAAHQEDDTAVAALMLNERGGIIDQVVQARLEGAWLILCSPPRREAVLEHLRSHADRFGARIDDQTFKTVLLGAVGPKAPEILDAVFPEPASVMGPGAIKTGSFLIGNWIALRVGPTCLWSLEVVLPNLLAGQAWRFITERAGANVIRPAGQAAGEILRIEAGLPRYGREFDENTTPVEAGMDGDLNLSRDFLGAGAVRQARQRGPRRRRVGLVLECSWFGGGAAGPGTMPVRPGAAVYAGGGVRIGRVTSAAISPICRAFLMLALVDADAPPPAEGVLVDGGPVPLPARASPLPFSPAHELPE